MSYELLWAYNSHGINLKEGYTLLKLALGDISGFISHFSHCCY